MISSHLQSLRALELLAGNGSEPNWSVILSLKIFQSVLDQVDCIIYNLAMFTFRLRSCSILAHSRRSFLKILPVGLMNSYKKSGIERRRADLFGTSLTATTPSKPEQKKHAISRSLSKGLENTHHPVNICIAKPGLLSNALSAFRKLSLILPVPKWRDWMG